MITKLVGGGESSERVIQTKMRASGQSSVGIMGGGGGDRMRGDGAE